MVDCSLPYLKKLPYLLDSHPAHAFLPQHLMKAAIDSIMNLLIEGRRHIPDFLTDYGPPLWKMACQAHCLFKVDLPVLSQCPIESAGGTASCIDGDGGRNISTQGVLFALLHTKSAPQSLSIPRYLSGNCIQELHDGLGFHQPVHSVHEIRTTGQTQRTAHCTFTSSFEFLAQKVLKSVAARSDAKGLR